MNSHAREVAAILEVGRPLSGVEYNHLYVANLVRDWPRLPTMEMKIARLRAFNKDLEIAW